jgi:hypothetical protein
MLARGITVAQYKENTMRRRAQIDTILNIAHEIGFLSTWEGYRQPYPDELPEEARELYKIALGKFNKKDLATFDFCSHEEVIATVQEVVNNVAKYADEYYKEQDMDIIEWELYRDRDKD